MYKRQPVYNVERYIKRCLEAALGQTFEDIEYILIDDCSTDRSVETIREYISKHPRGKSVKLILHEMCIRDRFDIFAFFWFIARCDL